MIRKHYKRFKFPCTVKYKKRFNFGKNLDMKTSWPITIQRPFNRYDRSDPRLSLHFAAGTCFISSFPESKSLKNDKMSSRPRFQRNFSSADSSWYRERQEEEWSPRSQDSDHNLSNDSDEENHESNMITIADSSSSSLESPLPWTKNSSFSHSSPATSLVLHSQGSKPTESSKELIPRPSSLVIGKRSRAIGLKDIDLTRNPAAKHIREAKEANKSPKKSHLFSPLSRHMSCPTFGSPNEICHMGPSDRQGKTSQTGLSRGLSFEGDSQFRSPVVSGSSLKVAGKSSTNLFKLFSCLDDLADANMQHLPLDESDCDWCERGNTKSTQNAAQNSDKLCLVPKMKSIEVIDLTGSDQISGSKISNYSNQSNCQKSSEKNGDVSMTNSAVRNRLPLKKKTSKFSFSDDEDSDSTECPAKRDKKIPQQPHAANEESQKEPHSKKGFVMKMCILFALCALSLSLYFHANPHGFCLESEFSKNISGIGIALKAELYGQHIAQKIVASAMKNHFNKKGIRKPLVMSFHGWTGIGKNFVSNMITEHFFKRKTHSPFVHKFIIPLHFPHESEAEIYNGQLQRWILGNISRCRKGGLFIFDEMDKIPLGMMDTIKSAILGYRGKKAESGYGNMVFIFLSNSGGEAINQHVLKHVLEGKLRDSLTLSELEIIFHGIAKSMPNVWFADLLKSEVIDHLVPFLPLERAHIKQCIRRDLVKKGFQVKEALVKEIADQMEYFPGQYEFFSVSGCKKVSSRVDVIMG